MFEFKNVLAVLSGLGSGLPALWCLSHSAGDAYFLHTDALFSYKHWSACCQTGLWVPLSVVSWVIIMTSYSWSVNKWIYKKRYFKTCKKILCKFLDFLKFILRFLIAEKIYVVMIDWKISSPFSFITICAKPV